MGQFQTKKATKYTSRPHHDKDKSGTPLEGGPKHQWFQ